MTIKEHYSQRSQQLPQADLRNAIPAACWEKNTFRSFAHLVLDVGIVAGLAIGAATLNAWYVVDVVLSMPGPISSNQYF